MWETIICSQVATPSTTPTHPHTHPTMMDDCASTGDNSPAISQPLQPNLWSSDEMNCEISVDIKYQFWDSNWKTKSTLHQTIKEVRVAMNKLEDLTSSGYIIAHPEPNEGGR